MESINLLPSRLLALVKYEQWSQDEVVDLFTALLKQFRIKTENTDFNTWMAKILYQVEIYKISKSDIKSPTEPNQLVDDIEERIKELAKNTKEKNLGEIIEEIRKSQANIDENILPQVKDIVSSVESSLSNSDKTDLQGKKRDLFNLCKAVEKIKKWKPRLTQMVSWCIMALSESSQLIQVGTGEGKSCIVAMFAAYLALTGKSVDIISSSPVLAERDAEEWREFYKQLNISVAVNTNKTDAQELRKCYECQVVYGTTQSFAGNWLIHSFHRENVRSNREFLCVIVDEVDSLMLDKGLELVYLSKDMPVMEALNVILAEIWFYVNQQEHPDVEDILAIINRRAPLSLYTVRPNRSPTAEPELKQPGIPGFQEHINARIKTWIKNAIHAKTLTLGHEYMLHKDTVVPVDYHSTGVLQNNMKWGDGLQQFLEMKHHTKLSNMSLITNFKSNVSLFKSYKQIFGLTGTLGNQTELNMLKSLYCIQTCKIPSFKRRKLYEEDGIVINDEIEWVCTVCSAVTKAVNPTIYRGPRAVLVICETIQRAHIVYEDLKKTISPDKMKLYTNNNMDNSKVTNEVVTEGCVIVATNLAGRGTDLKVCKKVNDSGGLFVVQTFMPLNIRVEQQGFGRTAREGNPGSAQLIMCSAHFSESLKLVMALSSPLSRLLTLLNRLTSTVLTTVFIQNEFNEALTTCQENPNKENYDAVVSSLRELLNVHEPTESTSLNMAKEARNITVEMRLSGFLEDDIPKITKKEELFSDYLDMLDTIYNNTDLRADSREDIVSSLHECWGMWLLMKFNENESTETLRVQLRKELESAKTKLYQNQSPSSMIYHYIRSGNRLRHRGSFEESIKMYSLAIENNSFPLAIAYYNRALSILSKRGRGYIDQALADLEKAENEVESDMKKLKTITTCVKGACKVPNMTNNTPFTAQYQAKHLAQEFIQRNIQQAITVLKEAKRRGGEIRVTKNHVLFLILEPSNLLIMILSRGIVEMPRELANIHSLGLNTIFSVTEEFSFCNTLNNFFR